MPLRLTSADVLTLRVCKKRARCMQDHEEISAQDVAEAIAEMHARKRYKNLFLVLETCQAATMFARVRSPNVFLLAASKRGAPRPLRSLHAQV